MKKIALFTLFVLTIFVVAPWVIPKIIIAPPSSPFVYQVLSLSNTSLVQLDHGQFQLANAFPNLKIGKVSISEERSTFAHISIEYEYYPSKDIENPFVGGKIHKDGAPVTSYGFKPARLQSGKHTATIELLLAHSSPNEVLESDSIELHFYNGKGATFFNVHYNFIKFWCKSQVNIYNAYRYCLKPSQSPKTTLFLSAEGLSPPPKIVPQTPKIKVTNINGPQTSLPIAQPAQSKQKLKFNGTFDSGLQNWHIQKGITYTANGGVYNSGGIQFSAKAYIPENSQSWKVTTASSCLSAQNIDSISVQASIKLDDIPKYSRAHTLGLTWYSTDNCMKGANHGGYAYIEKKYGWQTLRLDNKKARLNAKSFKISLIQNQTYGHSASTVDLDTLRQYQKENISIPDPVSAVWDDIKIDYQYSQTNTSPANTTNTGATGVNLLNNPSFSKTTAGWKTSTQTNWRIFADGRNSVLETTITSKKGGSGRQVFSQCIALDIHSGRVFEAGIDYQGAPRHNPKGGGLMRFVWYDSSDCSGRYQTSSRSDSLMNDIQGWASLAVFNLVRPNNTKSVKIDFTQSIDAVGERRIWWDNAYFHAVK